MHWSQNYIGLPYLSGGRGPEKVDCWGLLYLVYLNEFKIELPLYPGMAVEFNPRNAQRAKEAIIDDWSPAPLPFEGCAVAMSLKTSIHHVGVYTAADRGKVLHCWGQSPIIAETIKSIRFKGIKTVLFYRHRLWPTS